MSSFAREPGGLLRARDRFNAAHPWSHNDHYAGGCCGGRVARRSEPRLSTSGAGPVDWYADWRYTLEYRAPS